eukprot:Colp12_sorted_trinity150504_noHs@2369
MQAIRTIRPSKKKSCGPPQTSNGSCRRPCRAPRRSKRAQPLAPAAVHLKAPPTLSAAIGWSVEIRASDADDEVYVGEVAGVDEAAQTVKILFAGEDGTLQEDDAEFLAFTSDLLRWVEGPAAPVVSRVMSADQNDYIVPFSTLDEQKGALSSPKDAKPTAPVKTSPEKGNQKDSTAEHPEVVSGKPERMEDCVGRSVNMIFDFVPAVVTQTSSALQTLNLALQNGARGPLRHAG